MSRNKIRPGSIVTSRAGRDAGRFFVVLKCLNDDYCLISDGETRKIATPKKKNKKHLAIRPETLDSFGEKLFNDMRVCDSDLRKALESAGCSNRKRCGEETSNVQTRCD